MHDPQRAGWFEMFGSLGNLCEIVERVYLMNDDIEATAERFRWRIVDARYDHCREYRIRDAAQTHAMNRVNAHRFRNHQTTPTLSHARLRGLYILDFQISRASTGPDVPFIGVPKRPCKRVVIRAKEAQIRLAIIPCIPIDMVQMNRDASCSRIAFRPPTHLATLAVFLDQVAPDTMRWHFERLCAIDLAEEPLANEILILVIVLAPHRAILVAGPLNATSAARKTKQLNLPPHVIIAPQVHDIRMA
jgi:hypothetical protein